MTVIQKGDAVADTRAVRQISHVTLSRRQLIFAISGVVAGPYVVRNSGLLMPVRDRAPSLSARVVKACRKSLNTDRQRGMRYSWSGECWNHTTKMGEAERLYERIGML